MVSFMAAIIKHRKIIEDDWQEVFENVRDDLQRDIDDNRICENFALVLTFNQIVNKIIESFLKKVVSSSDYFFEFLNNLPDDFSCFDGNLTFSTIGDFMKIEDRQLCICMPLARQAISQCGMQTDFPATLMRELKDHESFIDGSRNLRINGTQRKAMIFDTSILGRD